MLRSLAIAAGETRASGQRRYALARGVAALRISLYPELQRELQRSQFMEAYLAGARERDTFFFLTHRHYLARAVTIRDRISCAIHHYSHERHTFDDRYRDVVYQGHGLTLWRADGDGHRFEIRLAASEDNRYEGDLSVLLTVDGSVVCRMAYSVVDSGFLGLPAGEPVIFATRNQTVRGRHLDAFDARFPRNSPQYFCLAAVAGIALASGMRYLVGIHSEQQIAFTPRQAEGFRNSYCRLWQAVGGAPVGRLGYLVPVPFRLAPLSQLRRAHRSRARARRRHWQEISEAAQGVLEPFRRTAGEAGAAEAAVAVAAPAAVGDVSFGLLGGLREGLAVPLLRGAGN